jgi:hypothetical protein
MQNFLLPLGEGARRADEGLIATENNRGHGPLLHATRINP